MRIEGRESTLLELIVNGSRLDWVYERNGVDHYMTPRMTAETDSPRQRFNITSIFEPSPTPPESTDETYSTDEDTEATSVTMPPTTTNTMPTTISPEKYQISFETEAGQFVSVANNMLAISTGVDYFTMIPVKDSETGFNLFYSDVAIVTPRTRGPFDFYLQTEFPLELPATFRLLPYSFHLNSSYGGIRNNILPTLEEIDQIANTSLRISPFTQLIDAMHRYEHVYGGMQIFYVGKYLSRVPNYANLLPFLMLPQQVQVITIAMDLNSPVTIHLPDFPITEHFAPISPQPLYPSLISLEQDVSVERFKISSLKGTSWYMVGLNVRSHETEVYYFEFDLTVNNTFRIIPSEYPPLFALRNRNESDGTIHFCRCLDLPVAQFQVRPYEIDVVGMYDLLNKSHTPEVAMLINEYGHLGGKNASVHFSQLLQLMWDRGHMPGSEIFTVASFMNGSDTSIDMLPTAVKLSVFRSVSWFYQTNEESFRLKYSWASDLHSNIQPYVFRFVVEELGEDAKVCINYGTGVGPVYSIFVSNVTKQLTQELEGEQFRCEFQVELTSNLEQVQILYNDTAIVTQDLMPDYYFLVGGDSTPEAYFVIQEYAP